MKILLLANSAVGLLSFRKEVVTSLLGKGHQVILSLPPNDRMNEIAELGCKVDEIDFNRRSTNLFSDLKLFSHYYSLIKRERPDVVLTYTIKPNIYGSMAASLQNIPYIVNITGLGTAVENPGILQKITVTLYKIAMRKARCIFFQNKGNEAFFAKRNINNKVHRLIPGSGVNINKFTYQEYPVSGKTKFLFISRIMKEKGIEEYFAAAKYFKAINNDVEFHVIGDCEEDYIEQLHELETSDIIIYHGRQKDVRPYIANCSCLIHPTFYPEGMSNVVLEAASSGRPVITTRRHGCMEAIEDGETGFLFEERDTEGLIASINKFLSMDQSQRVAMGKSARQKMENEFDRQIVINAYLDEINRIKC